MNLLSLLVPVACAAPPTPPTPPTPPAVPEGSPATPATPATPAVAGDAAPTNSRWVYKVGTSEVDVQTTGHVSFDLNSEAVFSLGSDGTLRVRERSGSDERLLTAQQKDVVWRVNGTVHAFNAEGKAWLRKLLAERPETPTPPAPPS